ncbi:MAG: hypothetical protein M1820_008291 [Bogoriella megaspora]|nr:MAG: hypothetical protein M1820_008291 [Bogoriella megaspora]
MGFLKHFRSKSKLSQPPAPAYPPSPPHSAASISNSGKPIPALPHKVLETLFSYICPHVDDQTYELSERSMIGDGCPLCDLRDISNCAQVCRDWANVAQRLLYGSVRIDAVHYCELEEILHEKRRRRSRHKNESTDPPAVRLQLLTRTLRENRQVALAVRFLKLPYMTRESCKAELARAVAVTRNLLYVDLPEGFYTGDPTCLALRQELQASCPDIRRMKYEAGSEQALQLLAHGYWPNLEVLELAHLAIEPGTLRIVLGSLTGLRELSIADIPSLDDSIFHAAPSLPPFPPLQSFTLTRIERITHVGLIEYLTNPNDPFIRDALNTLKLIHMPSISTNELYAILASAPHLTTFAYEASVSRSLPLEPIPPLQSRSLHTLYYEITSSTSNQPIKDPAESHYGYLSSSLHNASLPSLRSLYVRDANFADSLLLAPPIRPFANENYNPFSPTNPGNGHLNLSSPPPNGGTPPHIRNSNPFLSPTGGSNPARYSTHSTSTSSTTSNSNPSLSLPPFAPQPQSNPAALSALTGPSSSSAVGPSAPFTQPLSIYSKGLDELDWMHTALSPPSAPGRPSSRSGARPVSSFTAQLGPQWGGDARKSMVVGNGFGGFLAVPVEGSAAAVAAQGGGGGRPGSSSGGDGSSWGGSGGYRSRMGSLGRISVSSQGSDGVREREKREKAARVDLWR